MLDTVREDELEFAAIFRISQIRCSQIIYSGLDSNALRSCSSEIASVCGLSTL